MQTGQALAVLLSDQTSALSIRKRLPMAMATMPTCKNWRRGSREHTSVLGEFRRQGGGTVSPMQLRIIAGGLYRENCLEQSRQKDVSAGGDVQ